MSANTPYTSNASPDEIASRLRGARNVIVTTHAKPDGDALGSTLAIARALKHAGSSVHCWYVGPWPAWTDHLAGDTPFSKINSDQIVRADTAPAPGAHAEPDAIVICDTGSWAQLETLRPWLEARREKCVIIDHHLHGNADAAPLRLIDTAAAAATEVCAPVIDSLLGSPKLLPRDVATPLFLGLATDTGWFRFSNVRQQTLALASRLIGAGVDHASLYEMIEQQNTVARMRLLARALSSLELHKHASVALMSLTQADFKEAGADSEDTGGFADGPMSVVGVQVVVTLTEMTKPGDASPLTKASLRSKPGPHAIDVAAVCNKLGGGGHARAAGVKLKLPLASAREVVLKALQA